MISIKKLKINKRKRDKVKLRYFGSVLRPVLNREKVLEGGKQLKEIHFYFQNYF